MSLTRIKSIEEVVTDLRAKGELDEEALMRFRKQTSKFKFVSLALFAIAGSLLIDFNFTNTIIAIFIATGIYLCLLFPSNKEANKLLNLFSYGKITDGIVTSYVQKQTARMPPYFIIYVSYIIDNGKIYKNREAITGSVIYSLYDNITKLKVNDKIQIIYMPTAPEECWIYTEKLNNIFNIRKK